MPDRTAIGHGGRGGFGGTAGVTGRCLSEGLVFVRFPAFLGARSRRITGWTLFCGCSCPGFMRLGWVPSAAGRAGGGWGRFDSALPHPSGASCVRSCPCPLRSHSRRKVRFPQDVPLYVVAYDALGADGAALHVAGEVTQGGVS